jgi:hypothetical protein
MGVTVMKDDSRVEALEKELADLRQSLADGKPISARPKPVKVDLKYLCPKDPNYKKLIDSHGVVMIEDGPVHTLGWITTIENVDKKHRTFNQGREVEWVSTHQRATWKCQECGAEKEIDPYP